MNAEIKNGTFILYNVQPTLAGIEIHYAGNITIEPTLPEGWVCRASRKKIIILNLGSNILSSDQSLFTFSGKLNIKFAFAATTDLIKISISVSNPKRNWNNRYFKGADFTSMTENWDSIENKNESKKSLDSSNIVSQRHIKQTNKFLTEEKPSSTPSATKTTRTTGGY
tara:strand:- start:1762 stop:2265 length:504 start_codon:yes stop_codon:yes gene_type:complete